MKLDNATVSSNSGARNPRCLARCNAMVGGQDRARRFRQRAEYARRSSERLLGRDVVLVGRAITVANNEQILGRIPKCDGVPDGEPGQENVEREHVSGDRGDPRSHSVSSTAPLQHRATPPKAFVSRQGGRRRSFRLLGAVSSSECGGLATAAAWQGPPGPKILSPWLYQHLLEQRHVKSR
jgi:hypothetical protein